MPTVSVIIAAYNAAPYLGASLDSILAQTASDVEVIVVDDGSTDATPAVLSRYEEAAVILPVPHGGYAAARAHGLARASADWIAFHDADDVALPDRLAFQLDFVGRHPDCDGVVCDGERMEDGARLVPADLRRCCAGEKLTVEHLFRGFPLYFQASLVRRRALEQTGPFDDTLSVHPDMEYSYRLLLRAHLPFMDRVVFRYRTHGGNVTRDRQRGREEITSILERLHRERSPAAREIGLRRLQSRLALHYYRLAQRSLRAGDAPAAHLALGRAIALRPFDPRYRWLRLWHPA